MRIALFALLSTSVFLRAPRAEAEDESDAFLMTVLPGESHAISHAHSASRDTGLLAYQVLPHVVLSTGGDFAFLGWRFKGLDLRAGMFGLIEVQTAEPEPLSLMNVPSGPYLWRGLLGYSLALSLEEVAQHWLGEGSAIETALSFRHESEHLTVSSPPVDRRYADVPNIGNFLMPELACKKTVGNVDVELRLQAKIFFPQEAYSFGPGADLIFIWRVSDWIHPFFAAFGEYVFGRLFKRNEETLRAPDNRLLRCLAGAIFVGEVADLQLVLVGSAGNDKGLLAFENELSLGWAIRIGFFKGRSQPS